MPAPFGVLRSVPEGGTRAAGGAPRGPVRMRWACHCHSRFGLRAGPSCEAGRQFQRRFPRYFLLELDDFRLTEGGRFLLAEDARRFGFARDVPRGLALEAARLFETTLARTVTNWRPL